ncbi:O-antigen ligase family protein [Geodermatophilus sp. SYSU D01036]
MVVLPTAVRGRQASRALGLVTLLALTFLVGFWSQEHARYAYLMAAAPLLLVLVLRPQVPVVLGAALLPFLGIGATAGGTQVTASDALFALAFVGALVCLLLEPSWRDRGRDTRALLLCGAAFAVWLVAVMLVHGSVTVALNSVQTYQLFLVPLVLGTVVLQPRTARAVVAVFILGSVVLALAWILTGGDAPPLTGNKNPDGQMIANAMVLALALAPTWTWRVALLVPLGAGLVFTQSRGALLGAGVGIVVVLLLRGLGSWRRTLAAVVPLVVLVVVGYRLLPDEVLSRTTDFSTGAAGTSMGDLTAAQYSVALRETYADQGWQLVDANPVFGVGPGNYRTGIPGQDSYTIDPHNLAIRTAGDVGYPGLIAFGLLVVGTALVAYRRRRVNPYVAVALAVQAAVIVHGFVDVYWVRGTPVLPWLLLGMAVNRRLDVSRG